MFSDVFLPSSMHTTAFSIDQQLRRFVICLTMCYKYSYLLTYGRRIGDRTHAFDWYQSEWPSVTSNPNFKVTISQRQITRKWYNLEIYLQLPTNRKSYMIYRTAPFSITLNDPYPGFKVTPFFDAEYLRNDTRYRHSFSGILICVLVARPRRCLTLSNPVPWQNWMVAYLGYTLRMRTLFRG